MNISQIKPMYNEEATTQRRTTMRITSKHQTDAAALIRRIFGSSELEAYIPADQIEILRQIRHAERKTFANCGSDPAAYIRNIESICDKREIGGSYVHAINA